MRVVRVAGRVGLGALLFGLLLLLPRSAFAQASITGVVKDASGGVLPGVSVEASSPALIEKTRAAVTDGTGQYRIEDLRPGTYTITVTLQGFSTYKREGIELAGTFTATINADLKVGTLVGNRHGHRRDAGRRRAERVARDHAEHRRRQIDSHGAQLQRHRRHRARRRHEPERHGHRHRDDAVSDSRRPKQRRPADDRRPQHRQPSRRQPAAGVHRRRRQRAGSDVHHIRRPRRNRDRGPDDEHRAEDRRQPDDRIALLQRHGTEPPVEQPDVRTAGAGRAAADAARRRSTTSTAPSADRSSRTRSGTTSTRARRAARRRSPASTPTPMRATRPSGSTWPIPTTRCTRTARGKTSAGASRGR